MKEKLGLVLKEKKKVPVFNSYGFYTAEYCRTTKKPIIQQSEYRALKMFCYLKLDVKKLNSQFMKVKRFTHFLG